MASGVVTPDNLEERAAWLLKEMMDSDPKWATYPELRKKVDAVNGLEEAVKIVTDYCLNTRNPCWVGKLYGGEWC